MGRLGIKPIGRFPPTLFRIFTHEDYARDFVERGRIRFSRVETYNEINDKIRRDSSEGDGYITTTANIQSIHLDRYTLDHIGSDFAPGILHVRAASIMPRYVLCFTYPPRGRLDFLPYKFGEWVVAIRDPRMLANQLADSLSHIEYADSPLECVKIRYNHAGYVPKMLKFLERDRLSWAYKPENFRDEFEYRFAFLESLRCGFPGLHDNFRVINLNKRIDSAEIFKISPRV